MVQIKRGITRSVWLTGRYAIKFPRLFSSLKGYRWRMYLQGILANINEKHWWKHSNEREKLCPVKFIFPLGLILIMQRAEELTEEEYEREKENLLRTFSSLPLDPKRENFGKINGRFLLVDYGDKGYICTNCFTRR